MAKAKEKKTAAFKNFKLTESYTSFILGALAVVIVGILFISFARNKNTQTSSVKQEPIETTDNSKTSSAYTIKPGDDLWSISENIYRDGFKWVEIAKVNKLTDPGLIHAGNKLIIPAPEMAKAESAAKAQTTVTQNNTITGSAYTIKSGDNLWNIAVRAYGDGFKWPDIAKANNLENPNLIFSGNTLKIPR